MFQAQSAARDQSYFLFATTQEQLDFLRFPLGSLQKSETRALAAGLGLPVADKPDSQDICFAPTGDYAASSASSGPESAKPGEIVHADGTVLGDACWHRQFHGWAAKGPWHCRPASRSS